MPDRICPSNCFPSFLFRAFASISTPAACRPSKCWSRSTEPLEEVARAVPSAIGVTSTTSRGSAQMFVDFPWGTNMQQALQSVDAGFAQALPNLPVWHKIHGYSGEPDGDCAVSVLCIDLKYGAGRRFATPCAVPDCTVIDRHRGCPTGRCSGRANPRSSGCRWIRKSSNYSG